MWTFSPAMGRSNSGFIRGMVSAWSLDEGERILGPGEILHVPPNTKHGWHPVGDEDVRMLVEARPGARFEETRRQFRGPGAVI